jgi:hypothetical protein
MAGDKVSRSRRQVDIDKAMAIWLKLVAAGWLLVCTPTSFDQGLIGGRAYLCPKGPEDGPGP